MLILAAIGVISLILGLLFLSGKDSLRKIENYLNKNVAKIPFESEKNYKILGVLLIIFSCILLIIAMSLVR